MWGPKLNGKNQMH